VIVIVTGLPGSGKSYFACQLAGIIDALYINSDTERKKMLTIKMYTEKEKLSVYDAMLVKIRTLIKENKNVVVDATFYKNDIRKKFIEEVKGKVALYFIEVRANEALIRERLKIARPDSDADFEVYKKVKKQWEPLVEPHLIVYSGKNNIGDMLQKTLAYLHLEYDKRAN
jgi:predicted kinase